MDFQDSKEEVHHQDSVTELVVGRDSPLRERSPNDRERLRKVRQKLFELNEKFASLVTNVRKAIESESLDDIKTYVITLSMIFKEDHASEQFQDINSTVQPTSDTSGSLSNVATMSAAQMSAINSVTDVTSMFNAVSRYSLWDSLNFYLLESVVKKFCGEKADLLKSMEEYAKASDEFKERTLLRDFLDIWPGRSSLREFRDTSVIIMKIKREYTTCTLQDVAEREIYLENMFHFRRFLLNFSNANRGCVQIVWQVSDCLIEYMKKKIASMSGKIWVNETTIKIPGLGNHVMKVSFKKCNFQQEHNHPKVYGYTLDSVESLLQSHDFDTLYKMSIDDPETFWGILSLEFLQWMEPFQKVMDCNMEEGIIRWFTKGKLNISVNCVDRHAKLHSEQDALIWVKGTNGQVEKVTYGQLLKMVCQIANILKQKGVTKGDTVAIYMPVCPLAVASMLACTRIGAVHNVLFSRFNTVLCEGKKQMLPLRERIANAKAIITANEVPLGTDQVLTLKKDIDHVLKMKTDVKFVLVAKRTDSKVDMTSGRDYFLEKAMEEQTADCIPEPMDSEDDLFIIYTSGSSGVPKGVVHTHAGYLLHVAVTHKYYFDYKPGDIYACVADIGWITGHSYVVYGPLCNGATTVLFESSTAGSHVFSVIEQLKINQFYTTPSNIRALMIEGEDIVDKFPLKSLKIIGSVGEPLSGDAWKWFYNKVGKKRCHPVDTWWQTELGGIAMAPPCCSNTKPKPGPMKPSFGVLPVILNEKGEEDSSGNLLLMKAIPGMGRRLIGGEIFKQEYFQHEGYKGLYYTSDVAHKDNEGDFVVIGRVEDVIKFGDRFLNLPLIEESLSKCHTGIVEAFLVMPKSNHGEQELTSCIAVDKTCTEAKKQEIADTVQKSIWGMTGNYARTVFVKSQIERTFSGKVVKYALREIDEKCHHQLGTGDIKAYYYSEQFSRMAFEDYNVKEYVF